MTKNGKRGYAIVVIMLVVISVIAFAVPFEKSAAFWIGYIFALIAILYQIYLFKISFEKGADAKSKFYGFPIARLGVIYLILQIIISIVEMAVASFLPFWIALIINIVILALAMIGCITAEITRDEVVRQDERVKKDVSNMRTLQAMTANLAAQCKDPEMKKRLQELADEVRYSDPVSCEATVEMEMAMINSVERIESLVKCDDREAIEMAIKAFFGQLSERNQLCRMRK